ncbi:MAG: NAD-dependent epimerase/dehydratase family protein [Bacteroidia bacterium]|nr:NAD-dependent epimerase/dehydratase family protein [Bacteroidia bacterium]
MDINHVLITGVAGFIGSNLLDYLLDETDWKITGIDNFSTGNEDNISHRFDDPNFQFFQREVSQLSSLRQFEVVFHLAALPRIQPSYEWVEDHVTANLMSGIHLLQLMIREEYFPRMIYTSSSSIYGNPDTVPTNETEPIKTMNPYAFQKYELEKYLEMLEERYPLDYVNLRLFNPYGPRSFNPDNQFAAYSSVVGIFIDKAKNGKTMQITGDGTQKRDFVHVLDVADACYKAAIHPENLNTAFNIGAGKTLSILDLAKIVGGEYEFIPARHGEAEITWADVRKSRDLFGWEPKLSLDQFIREEMRG